jgi:hypothetical protein
VRGGSTNSPASERRPSNPPEPRKDRGELDAARAGRLPRLVDLADLTRERLLTAGHVLGKQTLGELTPLGSVGAWFGFPLFPFSSKMELTDDRALDYIQTILAHGGQVGLG